MSTHADLAAFVFGASAPEPGTPGIWVDFSDLFSGTLTNLTWAGGSAAALVLAGLLVWTVLTKVVPWCRRSRSDARRRRIEASRAWSAAFDAETVVLARAYAYETDLDLLLRRPLMADLDEPVVQRLVLARARARDLRPSGSEVPSAAPGKRVADLPYPSAVRELEAAFEAAESKARKVAQGRFAPAERTALRRARAVLATANDDAAGPEERRSAYAMVMRLLEGLVDVSPKALVAIEDRIGRVAVGA